MDSMTYTWVFAAYRTIFKLWGFFATVTVTSFILLVFTVVLGIICYLNYGKGLREYRTSPALAAVEREFLLTFSFMFL